MKRILLYILVFVISIVGSLYLTQSKEIKAVSAPALEDFVIEFPEKKQLTGLIDLEKAYKAHPRYKELDELQAELAKQQQDWQAWLMEQNKKAADTQQSKLEQVLKGQLEKIQAEYSTRLAARQKILQEQLTREGQDGGNWKETPIQRKRDHG